MKTMGVATLLLALILAPVARSQSPPQTVAPPATNNTVTPPTIPPGMDPNSPQGEVVRMLQSGVAENAILAYITHSSIPFNLNAGDMVYLNDLGTPGAIETAMTRRDQELGVSTNAPPSPPPGQSQEPQDVTEDYFYGALAPYGTWVNLPGYGFCWQPCAAIYDTGWAPYCTQGQWLYTDSGWYWISGYSWGWCVFHYGRWFRDAQRGWCWWPATTWAPSWVFWRYSGNECGWAPVPPHCDYSEGKGLVYNGAVVAPGYDFGMGANLFTFVPMANLFDGNTERYRLSPAQAAEAFTRSKALNDFSSNDGIIANDGMPPNRLALVIGKVGRLFTIRPVQTVAVPGSRGEQILENGRTLAISRPYFSAGSSSSLREGIKPTPGQQQPTVHQGQPPIIVNENPLSYPAYNNDNNNNNVIYVDSAGQNGPPVPTVTTAGPQDYPANAPAAAASGSAPSFWSSYAEAPAPVENTSSYMSPRLQSRERWQHHVQQPVNHHEFNPPANGTGSTEHPQSHAPPPGHGSDQTPHPAGPSSHANSPPSGGPPHNAPSAPSSGQNHGH